MHGTDPPACRIQFGDTADWKSALRPCARMVRNGSLASGVRGLSARRNGRRVARTTLAKRIPGDPLDGMGLPWTREGLCSTKQAKRKWTFEGIVQWNHYDSSTCNSSGLVDRCVPDLLPGLVLGREQAAPGYRGVSGHGKTCANAASSCGEQRRIRSLRRLVSRPMPVSIGSIEPRGWLRFTRDVIVGATACNFVDFWWWAGISRSSFVFVSYGEKPRE